MSEEKEVKPRTSSGILTGEDIEPHTAYVETISTKMPKIKVTRTRNRQREVKL